MSADRPDPPPEVDGPPPQPRSAVDPSGSPDSGTQDAGSRDPDPGWEITDRVHLGTLRVLEEGPGAPQCPRGHGRLAAAAAPNAETGVSLSCPVCGFRGDLALNLLHDLAYGSTPTEPPTVRMTPVIPTPVIPTPAALWSAQPGTTEAANRALPAAPVRPRGTRPDGTVRTCGIGVIGGWVPSGLWSPVVGLLVGLVATRGQWWWSLLAATIGYGLWWSAARWVWPRSPAVNRYRVDAEDLRPGMWIRLHGRSGPAGRVEDVSTTGVGTRAGDRWLRVGFTGGLYLNLPGRHRCHVVELRG